MHGWLNSPPWTDGAKRRDSRNLAFAFYLMSVSYLVAGEAETLFLVAAPTLTSDRELVGLLADAASDAGARLIATTTAVAANRTSDNFILAT